MRYQTYTDEALVALVRQGDEEAYAEVYRRYVAALTGFAESKLYSLEDARDVVQELFVDLWSRRSALSVDTALQNYLFAATRHRIIDHIRKNLVREKYAERFRQLSPAYRSLEEELNARELAAGISVRLGELGETTRTIYQLSREQGKSNKEIARALQISEQTVKNNISKALKHLRKTLRIIFFSVF